MIRYKRPKEVYHMKFKRVLWMSVFCALAVFLTFSAKSLKAAGSNISLTTSSDEYTNQLSVMVRVDSSSSGSLPSYACFASGALNIDDFSSCSKNSVNAIELTKDNGIYVGEFLVNTGGLYTVFVQNHFEEEKSVKVIEITNIDATITSAFL